MSGGCLKSGLIAHAVELQCAHAVGYLGGFQPFYNHL